MVWREGLEESLARPKSTILTWNFPEGEPGEHDVAGLEIAVDEMQFLGGDEGFEDLLGELAEVQPCERAFPNDAFKSVSSEKLHDDKRAVFVFADIVDCDDVRVLERCEGASLLQELAGGFRRQVNVLGVGDDALDCDLAVHPDIVGLVNGT